MSSALVSPQLQVDPLILNPWRVSVERFQEWVKRGVITENDNVELIEGIIVGKEAVNPPHATTTELLLELLREVIGKGYFVGSQRPIRLTDSQPEPDVMIVAGRIRDYRESHPTPRQVPLLIEVSDSTLDYDRTIKQRIYARSGIQLYWIVNIQESKVEVYSSPDSASESPLYRHIDIYVGDDFVPVVIEGVEIGRISLPELFN